MTRLSDIRSELPVLLAGAGVGALSGLVLSRGGGLPSILLLGAVAVLGLTPLAMALGRLALPTWIVLFGALYPLARFPADDPTVTFDRLFLGALLVGYALTWTRRPRAREAVWLQRSFLALAAAFFLSAVVTSGPDATANLAIWTDAFLLPLIVFWCAREFARDRDRLVSAAGAIALAGATIAILGLAQRFAGLDLISLSGTAERFDAAIGQIRISGPFPVPEPFALVLLGCLAGTLFWIRARGPAALLPGGLALALQLAAISLTYFRAAWLGAVLILLVALVAGQRSWGRRLAATAVAAAGLALAFVAAAGDESVRTRLADQENISGRLATYERGLEVFQRHPVSGAGFQRFEEAVSDVPQVSVEGVRAIPQAHSSLVSTMAEQGLLGLVPLLACAAALAVVLRALWLRSGERVDRDLAICVTGAALAYLAMSLTLTMIYYGPSNAVMALLVGLACGRLDLLEDPGRPVRYEEGPSDDP